MKSVHTSTKYHFPVTVKVSHYVEVFINGTDLLRDPLICQFIRYTGEKYKFVLLLKCAVVTIIGICVSTTQYNSKVPQATAYHNQDQTIQTFSNEK